MKRWLFIGLIGWFCCRMSMAETPVLQQVLGRLIEGCPATVGVAVQCGDCLVTLNDGERYPLMSVFKYHVAVTVLKKMEIEGIALDDTLHVRASQMHEQTYSPLRRLYPHTDFVITYADLLRYSVSESDNNACDILIDRAGGIEAVDRFIRSLGITGFCLTETEDSMHADLTNCYRNWTNPSAMVNLLKKVYQTDVLGSEYSAFLKTVMLSTVTGADKLRAGVPAALALGHKTGSSDRLSDGTKIGDNDVGVIYLPDGRLCFIAVFVKDAQQTDVENAQLIARLAQAVCACFQEPVR